MKVKKRAIKVHCNSNGWWGYDDLVKAIEDGWCVERMDYLYDVWGKIHAQLYVLKIESDK